MLDTTKLGEVFEPMINGAIDTTLTEMDFEGMIKAEVAKSVGNIPSKSLEIKNWDGTIQKMDLVHKSFAKLLKAVANAKLPVLLKGEAGTGKTHGAMMVAEAMGLELYALSVGEQTSESKILGFRDAMGNYSSTDFRRAFEEGGVFLLDEVDAGNPNVLLAINTGISNGFVAFPDSKVYMHKNFRTIATANTFGNGADNRYVGRNKLDKATVNRFVPMVWELDEDIEQLIVNNDAWLKVMREARRLGAENLDDVLLGQRNAIYGAKLLEAEWTFEEVFEAVILTGLGEDDQTLLSQAKKLWVEPKGATAEPKEVVETEVYTTDYTEPTEIEEEEFNFA